MNIMFIAASATMQRKNFPCQYACHRVTFIIPILIYSKYCTVLTIRTQGRQTPEMKRQKDNTFGFSQCPLLIYLYMTRVLVCGSTTLMSSLTMYVLKT